MKIELTNGQKGEIFELVEKYDKYVDGGFMEYKELSDKLNKLIIEDDVTNEDLMSITRYMDVSDIGINDFLILDNTVGLAIDEMFNRM